MRLSDLAPGLVLGEDVMLGRDLVLGAHVVIHAGSIIGDGCRLDDHAVVGKPPLLGEGSKMHGLPFGAAVLEPGAAVGTGGIVFAGARIGRGAVLGDYAGLRERAMLGEGSTVGRLCGIGADVTVGARVRIFNNVVLTPGTLIEDDAFLAPGVITSDNPTAGREAGERRRPPVLRRACRIGAAAVILPGVEIGEEALVGAGAVVRHDVAPRTAVAGVPARLLRDVSGDELLTR
jgi:acetyltransferase-like isoleucine patch superfamily enzyme